MRRDLHVGSACRQSVQFCLVLIHQHDDESRLAVIQKSLLIVYGTASTRYTLISLIRACERAAM